MSDVVTKASFEGALSQMDAAMRTAPEVVRPSKFWQELNRKHGERLSSSGIGNFKRTLAKDYFTWMRVLPWDSQIRFLISQLGPLATFEAIIGTFSPLKHRHIPLVEGLALNFLTRLIWAYAEKMAPEQISSLSEPDVGTPPNIRKGGRLISQDLANSVLEFQSFASVATGTVCELGGGYGRNAFVTASLAPISKYIMADISPALGVSQEYLGAVFPNKRHFRFRDFASFEEIRDEFEAADMVFLLPHQLALLPDSSVNLFVNISSLHEMRLDQIRHYLSEIRRLVQPGGHFYLKAWKVSKNPVENIEIREEDYPLDGWTETYRRTPAVQTRFFETLLLRSA
ncbi:putative sugar O-methyltransferase [Sphingomonas sp. F9_3S_D5_B_2]